jgi:hypothetical protein
MNHPVYTAKEIAHMIDTDPVMASKIKEFIKPERLLELLDIEQPDINELLRKADSEDLIDEVRARMR